MIKNIVFDIGNVLVRFQPDEAMREIGIEENKIAVLAHATYENPVWVELDRGVIPENEIIDEMVKVAPQYEADIRRFFKEGKAFVVKAFDYAADWIKEKRYDEALRDEGRCDILAYGIAFCRKRCRVVGEKIND